MVKASRYKVYLDKPISTRYSKRTSKSGGNGIPSPKPRMLLKLKKSQRASQKQNTSAIASTIVPYKNSLEDPMPPLCERKNDTSPSVTSRNGSLEVSPSNINNAPIEDNIDTIKTDFGISYDTMDVYNEEQERNGPIDDQWCIDNYLHELCALDLDVERTKEDSEALSASDISKKHDKRAHKLEDSFVQGISKVYTLAGKQKWNSMLRSVKNPQFVVGNGSSVVPFAFVAVSGSPSKKKLMLANAMLIDWQINLRKKNTKNDEVCPFYQPSTQNVEMRTFFAHMAKMHDWQFSEAELKGYKGSLTGVVQEMYAQRLEKYVSICIFFFMNYKLYCDID